MKCPSCRKEISAETLRCPYCDNVVPYYTRYDNVATVPTRGTAYAIKEKETAYAAYSPSYIQPGYEVQGTEVYQTGEVSQGLNLDVARVLMAMGVLIIGLQVIIMTLLIALLG